MAADDVLPKAVVFFVLIGGIQGLVAGETVLEKFPSPGAALDTEENELCTDILSVEFCLPDLVSMAINFMLWPFKVAAWGYDLASLAFIEGMPGYITLPLRLSALGVTGVAIGPYLLDVFKGIGRVIPFT